MYEAQMIIDYVTQAGALLLTPAGLAALMVFFALAVSALTTDWGKWVCFTIAMYAVTLPLIDTTRTFVVLAPPLQQVRAYARLLTYSMLVLLLIPSMISGRGWRRQVLQWPLILFFLFELGICVRLLLLGNPARGAGGLVAYGLLFVAFGIGVSKLLKTVEDFHRLLWCLAFACGLSAVGTWYQVAVNRQVILINGRLVGISGNPQHFAIIMSFGLQVIFYLTTRPSSRKWVRPLLIAMIAIMVPLMIWTGSRTGALSAVCGVLVLFHRNLKRFVIYLPVILLAVLIALPYFEGASKIAFRLVSGENTRGWVWGGQISRFMDNVVFGSATDTLTASENSYLAALADLGIFGASPLFAAIGVVIWQLNQLRKRRKLLGEHSNIVDLIMSMWVVTGVAMCFEGLLLGVGTFTVFWVYAAGAATAFVVDWARYESEAQSTPEPEYPQPHTFAYA